MGSPIRFQVLTLPSRPYEDFIDQVRRVEALGFDVAAVPDHFCDWANPPAPWLECWTLLAAAAAETSTVRLATNVTQIPLRNPGVLAHQAVTVDHISGGRLELGIGTGLMIDPGTEMIGLENWSNAERVARFGEYVDVLAQLLERPTTSYVGRYYRTVDAVMNPSSVQRPRVPIVVAALGPRMIEHAVRHADIWNTMSFDADFDRQIDELVTRGRQVDEECERIGRDPSSLGRSVNLFDAEARASGGRLRYYDDAELLTDLVGRLTAIGYTDIGLYYPSDRSQEEEFARLAIEVLPGLRGPG
jgi:alkanesulfonate monooxygenase SsuD/methylene tetrahydromethanopterin reductase-like flavin-dependent oxidoreductase (luciferase family)